MTVAIGMVCSDGVLVASDSMGSSGLIARPVVKVNAFETRGLVWTRYGSEFIAQRMSQALQAWDSKDNETAPLEIARQVAPQLAAAYSEPVVPPGDREYDLKVHAGSALILDWRNGEAQMALLPGDLAAEDCSDRRFVAIGSGNEYASVVYATLEHYSEGPMSLAQGCLVAYRVITAVCQVSSWGVGVPVQMAIADDAGARILSPAEIEDLDTSVQRWLTSEHDTFKSNLGSSEIEDLPTLLPSSDEDEAS